ncbi:hypothetical protein HAX54_007917 [Datura stramonium]|uniref:Berberine/berberine-like domain-containing protein n=1 Tax=Datura stramonium TaxID=4076 RepID=A0ABS8WXG5_DATST|nr:hypothetical protein [Datura stramonium]
MLALEGLLVVEDRHSDEKFRIAADNVVDARVMDVNGKILAWKLKLVPVPEKVTVFTIYRKLDGILILEQIKRTSQLFKAKIWGEKYFNGNFKRLAQVKSQVDPNNFFRNEQSIPPYHADS